MINVPDSIFPTNSQGQSICPKCKSLIAVCVCPALDPPGLKSPAFIPKIRLEKSARKGKLVTMITNLPLDEAFLKNLARELKVKTGSGGTFYLNESGGVIEIQGDHIQKIKQRFDQK